jgi:hypothetical protein
MARKLATQKLDIQQNQPSSIGAYLSCRLIPLDKNPGIRPIGVGEVLRHIIGKAIISTIKPQIVQSAGDLQLCAGQQAGCEAAMSEIFDDEGTDALLLVDATNAFNSINRKVLPWPPTHTTAMQKLCGCLFKEVKKLHLLKVPLKVIQ